MNLPMEQKHRLSSKEKVLGTAVNEGHPDSLLEHERTLHLISLKKVQL